VRDAETLLSLSYLAEIRTGWVVHPSFQDIIRPGGGYLLDGATPKAVGNAAHRSAVLTRPAATAAFPTRVELAAGESTACTRRHARPGHAEGCHARGFVAGRRGDIVARRVGRFAPTE
jgi:hypothetical protein